MSASYRGTPFDLTGRVVFIAGAGGLLGQEFAKAVCSAGADVVLADLREAPLVILKGELARLSPESKIGVYALDVTDEKSVSTAVSAAEKDFGTIDALVNSAAIDPKFDESQNTATYSQFTHYPKNLWEQSVAVNLTGLFLLTQRVCAVMEKKGKGSIVNLGSMHGMVGPDQRVYRKEGEAGQVFKPAVYSVCKAGVMGFTRYLATYYAGTQIRVNTLSPGGVFNGHSEEFQAHYAARSVMRRMSFKNEYHGAILFLVSEASSYMTGANLVVDGGWTAV